MSNNLFSGLSKLGLGDLEDMEVFEQKKESDNNKEEEKKAKEIKEEDILYDKTYKCPLCGKTFTNKFIKVGKNKLVGTDMDLRPRYSIADTVKYDCIVCGSCGYAALTRYYNNITYRQLDMIKDRISSVFRGIDEPDSIYTYDDALTRYQLALANAVVKKAHSGEKGYICLKMAWLLRGKAEHLKGEAENIKNEAEALKNQELEYIKSAYSGFINAMKTESFPICGMDEYTFTYVTAELARQCKDYTTSLKLISDILTSRSAAGKIKEKTRELKDLIKEEVTNK